MAKKEVLLFTPNCIAGRHGVSLSKCGDRVRLRLHSHGKDSEFPIESVRGLQAMNPEFRCRCLEILDAWKIYTSSIPWGISAEEAFKKYPWTRQAFEHRLSGDRRVTSSMVLSILPEIFRAWAKEGRERADERRDSNPIFMTGEDEYHPKWMNHILFDRRSSCSVSRQNSLLFRYTSQREPKTGRKLLAQNPGSLISSRLNKHIENLLLKSGILPEGRRLVNSAVCVDGRGESLERLLGWNPYRYISDSRSDPHHAFTRFFWLRTFWDHSWMREMIALGILPVDIPPEVLWEWKGYKPEFPRIITGLKSADLETNPDLSQTFYQAHSRFSVRITKREPAEKILRVEGEFFKYRFETFPVEASRFRY